MWFPPAVQCPLLYLFTLVFNLCHKISIFRIREVSLWWPFSPAVSAAISCLNGACLSNTFRINICPLISHRVENCRLAVWLCLECLEYLECWECLKCLQYRVYLGCLECLEFFSVSSARSVCSVRLKCLECPAGVYGMSWVSAVSSWNVWIDWSVCLTSEKLIRWWTTCTGECLTCNYRQ